MGRIRTVKPELFKHEALFELEESTGLPVRLAFIGLFTCCDREGRFKWRPRVLKLDILPYDLVDFTKILDALRKSGLILRYEFDGEVYGCIPNFLKHQTINQREAKSTLPAPDQSTHVHAHAKHSAERDDENAAKTGDLVPDDMPTHADAPAPDEKRTETHVHAHGEGKGKEGKGREGVVVAHAREPSSGLHRVMAQDLLDRGKHSLSNWERNFLADLCAKPSITAKMRATLDDIGAKIGFNLEAVMATWRQRIDTARKLRQWDPKWGPKPHVLGCLVPDELLQPDDGKGWTEWRAAS